ncbi:S8 family serine peptidase [Pseudobacteroides cellulosolvens]|uniref:S8 family serine peptidase n=1 Tax=Pseudobacteroides cellulosolvens TaxID=35825 RepID=UPI0006898EC1|nr:S8 family serine peptidase [Pseudobacteroides cellulosolvens]
MMLINYPGTIFSNTVIAQQNTIEKSPDHSLHSDEALSDCSHDECDGHSHEALCVCSHDECDGHSHEAFCDYSHDKCDGHSHEAICDCASCGDIKIAVFDSGISNIDTAGRVSFVEDKEILSTHGNIIASNLRNMIPNSKLYDVRILNNKNEGTYSNFAKGIDWAVENDIDIISLSVVGFEASSILEKAIKKAEDNNILVIAAAGNESSDKPLYPAAYTTVISVGAVNENSKITQYSNYGEYVDVYAIPLYEGTSYSTQSIVADAAKIIENNPSISVKEIREHITNGKIKNDIEQNGSVDGILYAAACAHTFNGSYTTTKQPTCTATGTKVGKCTKCGAVLSTVSIAALGHSYGSWTTTKSATCTTAGSRKRTCSRCSDIDTDTIAATGHTFNGSYTTSKQPTCTATGTKVGKCTKCDAVVSTVSIAALGHSYGAWTTKAATCTTAGSRKRTCSRCSDIDTETIAATGHSFNGSYTTSKEPTCTATGTKEGRCTKCDAVVSTVSIAALGHSYGAWTTNAATCTTAGSRKRTCSRCPDTDTETIAATGHTFNGSYTTSKEPTCTVNGTKEGRCTKCNTVVSTVSIAALGHDFNSWTVVQEETCTNPGGKIGSCSRCSERTSQSIPATGHTFNGSYAVEKEPTCTDEGTKVGRCTKCNAVVSTVSIPSLGNGSHSFSGSYTTTKEPTCTEPGKKEGRCTRCNAVVSTVSIPALGHDFNSWTIVQKETCTNPGGKIGSCSRCSERTSQSIPPTGHKFDGSYETDKEPTCTDEGTKVGKCTKCGTVVSTVSIPSLGNGSHSFSGSYTTTKEPTCTEPGKKEGICTRCDAVVSTVSIPKLGHDFNSWTIVQKETCTNPGGRIGSCSRCSEKTTESIPPTGHDFDGIYETDKKPTCIDEGTKVGRCTKCKTVVSKISTPSLGKTGHTFNGSYVVDKKPTCTEKGTMKGMCTVCEEVVSTVDTPPLGGSHKFDGSFTVVKKPTCSQDGKQEGLCIRCGDVILSQDIPAHHKIIDSTFKITPSIETINGFNKEGSTIRVSATCSSCGNVDLTNKTVISSSNNSVATVSNGRIISGEKAGSATMTASYEGYRAVCNVNVLSPNAPKLRSLTIIPGSETITEFNKRGSKAKVMAIFDNGAYDVTSNISFTSGNSKIAYVDNEGYIKSGLITEGTTLITAAYEGKTATCSVKVDMESEVDTKPLSLGKTNGGITIPEDLPVIGGYELEFGLDFIPATLNFGKEEFKIAVGVNDVKSVGENWRDFKNTLVDAKKGIYTVSRLKSVMSGFGAKTGKFSVTKGWKPELDVYGYIEGVMVNGVPTVTNGSITLMVEANYTSQTQYMIGPFPVYFEIGGGIKLESICNIKGISSGFSNIKTSSELKITPRFEVGGGIGVANVLTIGGTGEAELEFLVRDDGDYIKITLTGGLNLKVKALFFEAKKSIAKGTWNIYESLPTNNYMALPPPEFDKFDMYNLNEYSLMQRDYINRPSVWNGNGQTQPPMGNSAAPEYTNKEVKVLGTNIYPNAQPQLVNYGDGQILVWVSDNKERTSSNRTMLVYSIYDKESNSWSEPMAVADDGTADFYPQLAADGSNIYVVWQNSNKKFADDVTLEQVASSGEIAVSKFDVQTNTFGSAVQLTQNDLLDTLPKIAAEGNKAYITWTSNNESDIFGVKGKNSIYYCELEDDKWSSPKLLSEGLNAVPSISAGFIENSFTVAYVLDGDNVLDTINDREIYTVRPGSTSTRLTNNNTLDSAPAFSVFNGKHALYWYNEGNISYINGLGTMPSSVFKGPKAGLKDEFKVLTGNNNELAIIWPSTANGSTEIYSAIYDADSSEWSEAVKISNIGKEILTPEGVFDSNGNLKIAFNKLTQLSGGNEQADLCVIKLTPSYNLSVDSISFDHSKVIPGTQLGIDVDVTNNGEIGVEEVVVDIMENGEVINSSSVKVSIKPGETKNITALMDLPDTITKKTYSIKVTASEDEEYNLDDNTKQFTIGYTDITLQIERYNEGNIEHVAANILNLSHVPSGAVLKVTKGSEDGEVIDTKVIDNVEGIVKYEYKFDKNELCAGKDTELLYFTVTADEEELYTSDNSQLIALNSDKAKISGYVSVDFEYLPDVEAQIKSGFTVKLAGTDISTKTDANGHFILSGIPEDMNEYTLEISKPGYLKRNVNATGTGNVLVSSEDTPIILWAGDIAINGVQNGAINIMDLMQLAKAFNTISTDDGYEVDLDINRDGAINMADIFIIIKNFNTSSSSY